MESLFELGVCQAQRGFRVDQMARQINAAEQQIAHLVTQPLRLLLIAQLRLDLPDLFAYFFASGPRQTASRNPVAARFCSFSALISAGSANATPSSSLGGTPALAMRSAAL